MEKLLEKFAADFDGYEGIGAYVDGAKATPETRAADEQFHQYLDRLFPTFKVTPGSNCEPCVDLKIGIDDKAHELVRVYCRDTAKRAIRFGAHLMKELLEEGDLHDESV